MYALQVRYDASYFPLHVSMAALRGMETKGIDGCCIHELSWQGCCGGAFSYVAATLETRGFACDRGPSDGDLRPR